MSTASAVPTREQFTSLYQSIMEQSASAANTALTPNPAPSAGSRFLIWTRQSGSEGGLRLSYVPGLVLDGPRDARINTEWPGVTPVYANAQRDFLFEPGTREADCAHTFAVVREVLTLFQRARGEAAIPWAWNTGGNADPIEIHPRAGISANSFYTRGARALRFFQCPQGAAGRPVFTCRSQQIVAHACGHAILDGLKPGWLCAGNPPQTGALHESFADLTALFLACSQAGPVEAAIAISKGDLRQQAFLASLGEPWGAEAQFPEGLRNAQNRMRLSGSGNCIHAIARVFTGAIYDAMTDIFAFERMRQAAQRDPARVLQDASAHLCRLLLNAVEQAPAANAVYADVVNQMLNLSHAQGDPPIYRTILRNHFVLREVVNAPAPLKGLASGRMDLSDPNYTDGKDLLHLEPARHPADHAPQDRARCCGTMQLPEYTRGDQKKLERGAGIAEADVIAVEVAELRKMFAR